MSKLGSFSEFHWALGHHDPVYESIGFEKTAFQFSMPLPS